MKKKNNFSMLAFSYLQHGHNMCNKCLLKVSTSLSWHNIIFVLIYFPPPFWHFHYCFFNIITQDHRHHYKDCHFCMIAVLMVLLMTMWLPGRQYIHTTSCISICICICNCIFIWACTCICNLIHILICICICFDGLADDHVAPWEAVHIYITCFSISIYICICTWICICICVFSFIHILICICFDGLADEYAVSASNITISSTRSIGW